MGVHLNETSRQNWVGGIKPCVDAFFSAYPQVFKWAVDDVMGMQMLNQIARDHSWINAEVMKRAYMVIRVMPKPPSGGFYRPGSGSPRSYIDSGTMPWNGEFARWIMAKFGAFSRVSDYIREFGTAVTTEAALRNGKWMGGQGTQSKKIDLVELYRQAVGIGIQQGQPAGNPGVAPPPPPAGLYKLTDPV